MSDFLDDFDELVEPKSYTDQELFKKIWFSPREVFKFIHANKYEKYMVILLALAGIARAFSKVIERSAGDSLPFLAVLAIIVIGGALLGSLSYYIYAALLSWTGKWLKGEAEMESIIRMLAYALIPFVCSLCFYGIMLVVYGPELFSSTGVLSSGTENLTGVIMSALTVSVLGIWTYCLMVVGLSEVQNFSIGKAIFNSIIPLLLFLIPVILYFSLMGVS